jgi:hypothetical protein
MPYDIVVLDAILEDTWTAEVLAMLHARETQGWALIAACPLTVQVRQTGGMVQPTRYEPRLALFFQRD